MKNSLFGVMTLFVVIAASNLIAYGQTTFPGAGAGPIPDGPAGTCQPTQGAPLNITFNVTGIATAPSAVSVGVTFGPPNHSWAGDVTATLLAPNGTSFVIFGRVLSTTSTGAGDNSDLGGLYTFNNAAAGNFWNAATAAGATVPIAPGAYRTSQVGGAAGGGTLTDLNAAFAGIPTSNGTWTLRLTDGCAADTGSVASASLTLTGGVTPPTGTKPVDFNGDGRSDYSVVRNTGGGTGGQITWFHNFSGTTTTAQAAWGISTDFFVPEDYDGDLSTDLAVWRPGAALTAGFYILQSSNSTFRFEQFGQTGDDPTVVGDYNNDNRADIAVYRPGASAGQQSFWYVRTVAGGSFTVTQWGQNGDFPAPGDYDGDGSNDFVIQRNAGGGQANFWTRFATGTTSITTFGTPTDVITPGDYDGDGRTDYAVVRGIGGQIVWFYLPSSGGSYVATTFGTSATDFPTQGDYNGDGRTDQAVWRPAADPTQNFFFVNNSGGGVSASEWGQNGDYPVANFNTH